MVQAGSVRPGVAAMRGLAVAAVLALVIVSVSGCCIPIPGLEGGSTTKRSTGPDREATATIVEMTEVPDVLGLYYDEAAKVITAAGLEPVDVSIHGPIDDDAGEIGKIYRQTPKAGERVTKGSKVELRSWWESQ